VSTAKPGTTLVKQEKAKCVYSHGVDKNKDPEAIYDVAQSSCTTDNTDDRDFVVMCPGAVKVR
jgi:hypothetical protein